MTGPVIPQREALQFQFAAITGREPEGGFLEIRCKVRGQGMRQQFFPCDQADRAVAVIERLGERTDVYLGCAPRRDRDGTRAAITNVWCLWADVDSPAAVDRLRSFRPLPAIVIRSGSGDNVHAYWPLRDPLRPGDAEVANRRLATHLGADVRSTDAARILRPAGTLNHKHRPPTAVEAVRVEVEPRLPVAADVLAAVPDLLPDPDPITRVRAGRPVTAFGDPLAQIPASEYVPLLTGRPVGKDGKVTCPFHGGGRERTPSLHVYPDDRGWVCFGCQAPPGRQHLGGDIYTFGALLYGLDARRDFRDLRQRLAADLLRGEVAA
jgi:hypothetical protein